MVRIRPCGLASPVAQPTARNLHHVPKVRINEDMKAAMRARKPPACRASPAARRHQAKEVDERIELDDGAVLAVVDKMLKQRRDSVAQYEAAQRFDLASAERFEIDVLSAYKPAGLERRPDRRRHRCRRGRHRRQPVRRHGAS